MADGTKIEWTDATLNVVNGCTIVSPGCTNCYAMRSGARGLPNHPATGLTKPSKAGHVWTGEVRFNEKALLLPLRWKRPRRIFWNAHGDLFHENVPDEWIDRCFAVMALTPHHTHQVLTKRPERMRRYLTTRNGIGNSEVCRAINKIPARLGNRHGVLSMPLPNVWLGVSVEDQQRADERIPILLDTPAAVRWLSCEPLLGPLNLRPWIGWVGGDPDTGGFEQCLHLPPRRLNWVVVGGESGPGSRPMHPDWLVALHDQCEAAGVPFLFKQWGDYTADQIGPEDARSLHRPIGDVTFTRVGKKAAGRKLFGIEHNGYPVRH